MSTQEGKKIGYSKASIAAVAAITCLVIYILACVMSPVSWSPDSSKIALMVSASGEEPKIFALFVYDILTGEHLLLDKVGEGGLLSGPAWSPDGKWIAYYKVDEPAEEEKAEESSSDAEETACSDTIEQETGSEPKLAEVFVGEDLMLPPILELLKKEISEGEEDYEALDVKLVIVSPDGETRKVIITAKWLESGDDQRSEIIMMQPEWSKDSRRIFYGNLVGDEFYIGSIDVVEGEPQIHLLSVTGKANVCADGKSVASFATEDILMVARTDGSSVKYFRLEDDVQSSAVRPWSADSKKFLIQPSKTELMVLDLSTEKKQLRSDPGVDEIGLAQFSADGRKIYYIGKSSVGEGDSAEETYDIRRVNVKGKRIKVVFSFPKNMEPGQFSISPNGKIFLLRGIMKDEGQERSILLFWDGKKQKIVETDPWLEEVFK